MLIKKYYLKILFIFLSTAIFALIKPATVFSQSCSPTCDSGSGWFCSSGQCCQCDYGMNQGNLSGPVTCCNPPGGVPPCETHTVSGCNPRPTPGPTSPPSPSGVPTSAPTPVTYFYLCMRPGAIVPSDKCESTRIPCSNPDISGGSCFTTLDRCISGCVIPTGISITPRPELNILTPCATRGIFNALDTAIGCFPASDTTQMLTFILRWALGLAGGITFLLIVVSAFLIMSSGGNPEKVKAGRELLTASIAGLILVIFSVFILDLLGIRILKIPGL